MASRRSRSASCSRSAAFLPLDPKSPDLVRRRSMPKLERRVGCGVGRLACDSGTGGRADVGGGVGAPAEGVRGRVAEPIIDQAGRRFVAN